MKASERAVAVVMDSITTEGGVGGIVLRHLTRAIEAAEREAFEAGYRYGESADLEGHDATYDDWQKERDGT